MTFDLDAFNAFRNDDWSFLKKITDQYDSFENWPWALMYEKLYQWYPDARFILTTRTDADTWFTSLSKHGKRIGPLVDYELYIYGYAVPDENKQAHIDFYNRHNADVQEFFKDKPGQLLIACWEKGHGWPELAQFLGLKPPQTQFPHVNKTPSLYDELERKYRPILGYYKQKLFGKR